MIISSISDLFLQYDESLGLLRIEWISTNTRNLRATASQLLQLLQQLAVRHLLIDMDTVPDIPVYDQMWLGTQWMPNIVDLPLERLVLIISSTNVHNQLAVDTLHDSVQPYIRFDSQYFTHPAEALHWLTDGSERLPALLAEWSHAQPAGLPLRPRL